MGAWQAPVVGALCGGGFAGLLILALRKLSLPGWLRTAVLGLVLAMGLAAGATAPVLRTFDLVAGQALAVPDPLGRARDGLDSTEIDVRLGALGRLSTLAMRNPGHQPLVVFTLSAFVRDRAPAADPGCGATPPAADIAFALTALGTPTVSYRGLGQLDLHGTCLAWADLSNSTLDEANLAGANLTNALCAQLSFSGSDLTGADLTDAHFYSAGVDGVDLTGADLTRTSFAASGLHDAVLDQARFADTDVSGARWSEETRWPARHEDAVIAASSFDTTDFVIGELRLTDDG